MSFDLPNLRHMRVLREAISTGSISAAASACNLSQPAASQAIAGLEQEFGTPLLIRRARELIPTPAGSLLAARFGRALDHLGTGARAAFRVASGGEGRGGRQTFDHKVTAAQLRALIAISSTGSFALAAKSLDLSQPSVHRAARNLEALAGLAFFRATPIGVELTAAAKAFVLGAKLAQAEIRQGKEEVGRALGEDRGTFVLGSLPLARTYIVPAATHAMISEFDRVQIRVVDGRYGELLRSLREGDIDCLIGALRDPMPAEDVVQEHLFDDALEIVAHPSHPLFAHPAPAVEDTLAYPWVAPPRDTPAGSYLFETLRIHEREVTPVRAVSSSLVIMRQLLGLGDYVSIVSRHQIMVEERDGHIAPLPIPLRDNSRAIGLTYRADWQPTETQIRFIGYLREFAGKKAAATATASAAE